MIEGTVSKVGVPEIELTVGGHRWTAIVDTGFNGDLELPLVLWDLVNPRYLCRMRSQLAGGSTIEEDCFLVVFPFDGQQVEAEATFVDENELLIGTHLLQRHRLQIDFAQRILLIETAS